MSMDIQTFVATIALITLIIRLIEFMDKKKK